MVQLDPSYNSQLSLTNLNHPEMDWNGMNKLRSAEARNTQVNLAQIVS